MVPISGIAPGDRLYLRHRSTRLFPSRYMQTVVSTGLASSKDTPHDVRPHSVSPPIEYSTEPADSTESLRHRTRFRADGRGAGTSPGVCNVSRQAVVSARWRDVRRRPSSNKTPHGISAWSCRRATPSRPCARSYSSPRHTWALTRGIVRGRVVWRHDLAGRSSLGRRALGSSTPRSPPYSSHAAGSPGSAAPAVSHTRLAAVAAFAAAAHCRCCHCCRSFARTNATDTGPSSASCRRRRCRRLARALAPLPPTPASSLTSSQSTPAPALRAVAAAAAAAAATATAVFAASFVAPATTSAVAAVVHRVIHRHRAADQPQSDTPL